MTSTSTNTHRIVVFLIVFFLVGFAALAAYVLIENLISKEVLANLQIGYALNKGLLLLISHLIPIQAAGVMVAYSLLHSGVSAKGTRPPFHSLVSGTMVLVIILAALFIGLENGVLPVLERRVNDKLSLTRSAREHLAEAKRLEEEGDLSAAVERYSRYLAIDPQNTAIADDRQELEQKILESRSATEPPKEERQPAERIERKEYDPEKLILMARDYIDGEDYFSAHYYANLALSLDAGNDRAKSLLDLAWEKLNSYSLKEADREKAAFFETKLRGLSALEEKNYIDAYYIFLSLSAANADDKEIPEFIAESLAGLRSMAFFVDEARSGESLPGTRNLLFVNPREDEQREIIHIDAMTSGSGEIFFYGIELLTFSTQGELVRHFTAPYGKLMKEQVSGEVVREYINMNCRDKEDQSNEAFLPVYRAGRPEQIGYTVTLSVEARFLPAMSVTEDRIRQLGIYELWKLRGLYESAGYEQREIDSLLLMRIARPFLFLILAVLGIAMGWSYRNRYLGRPPLLMYLLIAAAPVIMVVITELFLYAHEIIINFFLLSLNFVYAAVFLFLIEALALIISLFVLSGQMSEA
jgi:hypothetical protein